MARNDFSAESPSNYEEKTICCFVLDTSSSMEGRSIGELNNGLRQFYEDIREDPKLSKQLEVALITFSDKIQVLVRPSLVKDFSLSTLNPGGTTRLVDGTREAIKLVAERKEYYKHHGIPYRRPWIILITDGEPDEDQDVLGLADEIEAATKDRKFVFLPIGVTNAKMEKLDQIAGYLESANGEWRKGAPKKLEELGKFSAFFEWLKNSLAAASTPNPDGTATLPDDNWSQFRTN